MAAAADRLSALPDDLLQHILSFAPARKAAASAILSRRWRPLWRSSSVLNLDSEPYYYYYSTGPDACFNPFFRDAKAALAAFYHCGTALKRLTLVLTEDAYLIGGGMYRYTLPYVKPEYDDRVAGLLADPAAAELEELRVAAQGCYGNLYPPPLASLPCAATMLQVLELDSCNLEPSPSPTARLDFPRLMDLTLRNCFYVEWYLQALVDAAPALTSLKLVDVTNKSPEPHEEPDYMTHSFNLPLRVRCPTVTDFVLVTNICLEEHEDSRAIGIQLDMPSLRTFHYRGFPVKLSLTSPATELARVDFDASARESGVWMGEPPARMLGSFSSTRALKLHINAIEDIIGGEEEHSRVILPTFPNLKILEVDGKLEDSNNMALGMGTLFRSCPSMAELRLRLNGWYDQYDREGSSGGAFAESMERFNSLAGMCSAHRDIVELGGVSELSDAFTSNCTLSCLRKVTLRFKSQEVNCFQVQLAKFLVENAMVLEEMYIEDGSQFWQEHLCQKVVRWRADAFQRRNLRDTACLRVYQMARPVTTN
ncbi:hypothetical protein ACQ4PT_046111 [Festuca glaucescens]